MGDSTDRPLKVSMFRFKLRTLIIATTLVAVVLGLQVYVHRKAKWLHRLETARLKSRYGYNQVETTTVLPASFNDVCWFRRRFEVKYVDIVAVDRGGFPVKEHHSQVFQVGCIGNAKVVNRIQYTIY